MHKRAKARHAPPQVVLNHTRNNKLKICFAPTIVHKPASFLIFWRRCIGADSLCSKILAFLSFNTSQQTRMIMERSPRLAVEGVRSRFFHQVCTESPSTQAEGRRCSLPSHIAMPSQMHERNEYRRFLSTDIKYYLRRITEMCIK